MGVAVEIELTRSRAAARWAALCALVPAAGLMLAAAQLVAGPTLLLDGPVEVRALLAVACAALSVCALGLAVLDLRLARGRGAGVALRVDEDGVPTLQGVASEPARPMALRASCTLPGLTLLVMAPYSLLPPGRRFARPTVLLVGRDAVPGEAWRRLHVWLRWIERGRTGL